MVGTMKLNKADMISKKKPAEIRTDAALRIEIRDMLRNQYLASGGSDDWDLAPGVFLYYSYKANSCGKPSHGEFLHDLSLHLVVGTAVRRSRLEALSVLSNTEARPFAAKRSSNE